MPTSSESEHLLIVIVSRPRYPPMKLESRTQPAQQMPVSIEVPFGPQKLTVKWPSSDPDGCARFIRELA